jgi:general secretion pathway protein K
MILLALVATLAAGMVWQQARAVQVEQAERGRTQAAWILNGALDWARLILREDARTGGPDHLGEPWAVPLAEARLSTFLAADRDNNAEGDGPDAFLSGAIADAQAKFNLSNLVDGGKVSEPDQKILARLCETLGLATDLAERIAKGLAATTAGQENARIAPRRVADLVWLDITADEVARLQPYVELLPVRSVVNLNTAPREVIAAVLDGVDLGSADRLVQSRQSKPFKTLEDVRAQLPGSVAPDARRVGISSSFFEVRGRLRLDERVLEERSIVWRNGREVTPVFRERQSAVTGAGKS